MLQSMGLQRIGHDSASELNYNNFSEVFVGLAVNNAVTFFQSHFSSAYIPPSNINHL